MCNQALCAAAPDPERLFYVQEVMSTAENRFKTTTNGGEFEIKKLIANHAKAVILLTAFSIIATELWHTHNRKHKR